MAKNGCHHHGLRLWGGDVDDGDNLAIWYSILPVCNS